jgi:hypothetical protein
VEYPGCFWSTRWGTCSTLCSGPVIGNAMCAACSRVHVSLTAPFQPPSILCLPFVKQSIYSLSLVRNFIYGCLRTNSNPLYALERPLFWSSVPNLEIHPKFTIFNMAYAILARFPSLLVAAISNENYGKFTHVWWPRLLVQVILIFTENSDVCPRFFYTMALVCSKYHHSKFRGFTGMKMLARWPVWQRGGSPSLAREH